MICACLPILSAAHFILKQACKGEEPENTKSLQRNCYFLIAAGHR